MRHLKFAVVLFIVTTLIGCASVPKTNDPAKKLEYANELAGEEHRPIPAEKLIQEAIMIYSDRQDDDGLAMAYRTYGMFFRSAAVLIWRKYYKKYGFLEVEASFDNRFNNSIDFFKKAESIYLKQDRLDKLRDVYLHMGITYKVAEYIDSACKFYKKSKEKDKEYLQTNPGQISDIPNNFNSYQEYIDQHLTSLMC